MRDFARIIELAKARGCKTVVEIGGIRSLALDHEQGDGHATKHWTANFERVFSYDIDPQATSTTLQACAGPNLVAETRDGIEALASFPDPIDLLYLDAWDVGTHEYMENHVRAFQAAEDKLHPQSLVLIDDTEFPGKGKGGLVIEYAVGKGWVAEDIGKQTLLFPPGV